MNGFAVRQDGTPGWRAVGSSDELYPNEYFSEVEPLPVVPPAPTDAELVVQAKELRDQLLSTAANRMGPLLDAVEAGVATDGELALLALWRLYRIDLNRIELQDGFPAEISWPVSPDEALATK